MNKKAILKAIKENGGASITATGKVANLKSGYMVSLYGKEYKTDNLEKALDKIESYLTKIKDSKNKYVGVWYYDNYYYIDISIKIANKTEALETGKDNKQIAIYNNKDGSELFINDYYFNKLYSLYKVNYLKNDIILLTNGTLKDINNYINNNNKSIYNFINWSKDLDLNHLEKLKVNEDGLTIIVDYILDGKKNS